MNKTIKMNKVENFDEFITAITMAGKDPKRYKEELNGDITVTYRPKANAPNGGCVHHTREMYGDENFYETALIVEGVFLSTNEKEVNRKIKKNAKSDLLDLYGTIKD